MLKFVNFDSPVIYCGACYTVHVERGKSVGVLKFVWYCNSSVHHAVSNYKHIHTPYEI